MHSCSDKRFSAEIYWRIRHQSFLNLSFISLGLLVLFQVMCTVDVILYNDFDDTLSLNRKWFINDTSRTMYNAFLFCTNVISCCIRFIRWHVVVYYETIWSFIPIRKKKSVICTGPCWCRTSGQWDLRQEKANQMI